MSVDEDALWRELEQALDRLAGEVGQELVAAIRPIIWQSHTNGRVARRLKREPGLTPAGYVTLVCRRYQEEFDYVCRVRGVRDVVIWQSLSNKLGRAACRFLKCWGYPSHLIPEVALDYTQSVVEPILTSHFPFDIPFDAWIITVLRNTMRKGARATQQGIGRIEYDAIQLDDAAAEWIPDPAIRAPDYDDIPERLQQALNILPPQYREFYEVHHVEGLSYRAISTRTGQPVAELYELNKKLIKALRQNLL